MNLPLILLFVAGDHNLSVISSFSSILHCLYQPSCFANSSGHPVLTKIASFTNPVVWERVFVYVTSKQVNLHVTGCPRHLLLFTDYPQFIAHGEINE